MAMTLEMFEHIREDVRNAMVENRNEDPALMPELVMYLLDEFGKLAREERRPMHSTIQEDAAKVLERCQLRAISKIPFEVSDETDQQDYDPDWRDHR